MQFELAGGRASGMERARDRDAVRKVAGPQAARSRARRGARAAGDPNVRRLEADLSEKLAAAVSIEHGPKGGRVVIRYNGLDELEGIFAHIK